MPDRFLVATYSDAESLMRAVQALREDSFRIYDVYAPYPVHDLDHVLGLRRTRLPLVTLVAGASALLLAVCFQFYAAVLDWPLNVGGKPDNSSLAFVPICFEATVLMGGLTTFAALLFRARLFPGKTERLPANGLTDDKFALVLRKRSDNFDQVKATDLMEATGAEQTWEFEGRL